MKEPRYTTGWREGRLVELWSGYDCREVCEHGSATGGGREGHGWTSDTLYVAVRSVDDETLAEATSMTINMETLRGRPMSSPRRPWSGRIVTMHTSYPTDTEQVRGEPEDCSILPGGKCFAWVTSGLVCEEIFTLVDASDASHLMRDDEGLCLGFLGLGLLNMSGFWLRLLRWHKAQAVAARAAREGLPHRCAACDGTGLIRGAK